MREAHRGVCCSKGIRLMEAELFAAERRRPAPDGRALLCAAVDARKIQGNKASKNLPDARNRAPVTPVSLRDRRESRCKGGFGGVKRGQGNHTVPLPPFAPRRGHGAPPAGEHRHLRRQTAALPRRRRRPLTTLTLSINSPPAARRFTRSRNSRFSYKTNRLSPSPMVYYS